MNKHGHVTPNPDGSKARCGGPSVCKVCALELAQLQKGNPMKHEGLIRPIAAKHCLTYKQEKAFMEEMLAALAQVEAETLERAIANVRALRSNGKNDRTDELALQIAAGFAVYNFAIEDAERALRSLSPNPTPTKSVVPEGMVMVPVKPTDKMLDDGHEALTDRHKSGVYGACPGLSWGDAKACYRAMIQAAPDTDVSVSGGD